MRDESRSTPKHPTRDNSPAQDLRTIAVAATDSNDERERISSEVGYLDIAAPGTSIRSVVPGGGTATKTGTSQATPHVTAAIAVLAGEDGPMPGDFAGARDVIFATAHDLGTPGKDESFGRGRLDLGAALEAAGWAPNERVDRQQVAYVAGGDLYELDGADATPAEVLPATGARVSWVGPHRDMIGTTDDAIFRYSGRTGEASRPTALAVRASR